MEEYAKSFKTGHNIKKKGDKLILNLFDNNIIAKYNIIGKCIHLTTKIKLEENIRKETELVHAKTTSSKEKKIYEKILELISDQLEPKTFAIKVNRKGEHNYNSTELARNVAGAVFEKWPNIKVKLDKPKMEIFIQIINNRSIIYLTEK